MKVAFVRFTRALSGSLMPGTRYIKLDGHPGKGEGLKCISIHIDRDLGVVLFRRRESDPVIGVPVLACDFIEFMEPEPVPQHKDAPHAQRRS